LENVWVADEGRVDFLNYELTSNGRGVVYRGEMRPYTDDEIDLPRADIICFITRRNDVVPPVARLSPEQGAAFFMLGESIETSAGDPTQAGKSLRVVGTNPFIVGPEFEEGNRILNILKKNPNMECFVLNTGRVGGPEGEKITVVDSAEIIKQIVKGGVEWRLDPDWGYEVPSRMDGVDMSRFDPTRFYSLKAYKDRVEQLRNERKEWLERFPKLNPEITAAIP
jgi:phosphoenolpyruvate carboxykinase (ATP)